MKDKDLLTVGEISDICNISTRILRHYDKIGLLKPAQVDKKSSYRYYSRNQIFTVSMIQDLKVLGFSLKEIKEALKRETLDSMANLYQIKKKDLAKEIQRLNMMYENVNYRLEIFDKINFLEKNLHDVSDSYIELKLLPKRLIYSTNYVSSFDFETIAFRVREIQTTLEKKQVNPQGPYVVIFHDSFEHPDNTKLEVGVFLNESDLSHKEIVQYIPEGLYIVSLHWGPHETSIETYNKLLDWIKKNNYQVNGGVIKIYIKSLAFTTSKDDLISEIQIPVVKIK